MKFSKKSAFINRKQEMDFLKSWISEEPDNILFVIGPKSSGKTTLLYKFIEKNLNNQEYDIKHFNLREILLANYKDFVQTFFEIDYAKSKDDVKEKREYDLKVFKLSVEVLKGLENMELNPFAVMKCELKKLVEQGIRPVIIIDELQALEGIYMNGQRELLKELFNFFVAMTKESHLCHVMIASSDSYFVERIYNDSKLNKTSRFLEVNYLEKEDVYLWLNDIKKESGIEAYDLTVAQKDKIWDTFGGSVWEISDFLGDLLRYVENGKIKGDDFDLIIEKKIIVARSLFDDHAQFSLKKQLLFKNIYKAHEKRGHFKAKDLKENIVNGGYMGDELRMELGKLVGKNFIAYHSTIAQYTLQGKSMEHGLAMYVGMLSMTDV